MVAHEALHDWHCVNKEEMYMLFQTTKKQEDLRKKVREFAESEVKPIAFLLDKENEFPSEAIAKFADMGMMGLPYPKEYGGAGADVLSYAIAVEELSRVDGGTGVILSAHVSLGSYPIFAFGNEEQKQKYFCLLYTSFLAHKLYHVLHMLLIPCLLFVYLAIVFYFEASCDFEKQNLLLVQRPPHPCLTVNNLLYNHLA